MSEFYERQINILDSREAIREINSFVKDYLNAQTTQEANTIKELIIWKATQELSRQELIAVRDSISEQAKKATWQDKSRLYELAAWLYNNTPSLNESNETSEIPFEVVWGSVIKKVLNVFKWKIEEKTYNIRWWEVEPLWDGKYRVVLNIWRSRSETILLWYRWWNTIQVFDGRWDLLWTVPIRYRNEYIERWRVNPNWTYVRRWAELNPFIEFNMRDWNTKIQLELSFPWR